MPDPLDIIPDDLVDLSLVARKLGVRMDKLRSQPGFPTCVNPTGRSWRVSASAVAAWYATRSHDAVERAKDHRARTVRARAGLELQLP